MKTLFTTYIIVFCFAFVLPLNAQKYTAKQGTLSFYSHAAIEDITAENSKVASLFNAEKNEIAFSVPIKQFKFKKKLMQEHFNEKYMESEKFPTATYTGSVEGFKPDIKELQQVSTKGKLTIHGVTKEVSIPGTIELSEGKLILKTKFMVKLEDYNIKIPQLLWQNIAEQVEVTVDVLYIPLK